jgi:hypothetical protein
VSDLCRECGDLSESRRIHSEIGIRVGVTSGVGLMISSIIAAFGAGLPLIALITVFGGGWMSGVKYFYGSKLNEEAKIYKDMSERTGKNIGGHKCSVNIGLFGHSIAQLRS